MERNVRNLGDPVQSCKYRQANPTKRGKPTMNRESDLFIVL